MTADNRQVTGYDPRAVLASRREAPPFVDHCTEGLCGEPASSWLASRPGEAWCGTHAPPAPSRAPVPSGLGLGCLMPGCGFTAGDLEDLAGHAFSHARSWRDEAQLVERKRRAERGQAVQVLRDLRDVIAECERGMG